LSEFAVAVARYGPAAFFTMVAVFYTARIVLLGRRLGFSPVSYGDPGSAQHRHSLTFRWFRVAIWLACLARARWPGFDIYLGPLPALHTPPVMLLGNAVMLAAFALVAWLNLAQGNAWRSGVAKPHEQGPLVTGGLYRHTRHPMFAAVIVGQAGFFLAIPSLFTLLCLVVGVATIRRQAALEEDALERLHGDRWRAYAAVTPRWPWSMRPFPWRCHKSVT
jgi:protein-S-isoprenylcysteine O-methyltransferase Ste14